MLDANQQNSLLNSLCIGFFLYVLFGLCGLAIGQQDSNCLGHQEIRDGWIKLFDGKSLFGWSPSAKTNWAVEEGEIRVSDGEKGILCTTSQFDNYLLRLKFRCTDKTNSGIFLRTSPRPKNPANDCLEFNIAPPDNLFPTGSLVGRVKADRAFDQNDGQWHQVEILVEGERFHASIDDQEFIEYETNAPLGRGFIGLQFNKGEVAFKDIYLKPLNMPAIADWNQDESRESTFEIGDANQIHVTGGSGQLESESRFGDFIFSMQCRTNAPGLNSGIFFRCIPGDYMMGYESQIQNQFENEDPTQPKDCGTGGIFRRVNARRVVANDEEWFSKTIVATGPHISVWVNGEQVTDWTDERKADKNPRRGKRLAAGTIIIQGHDPTTDIDFKDLRARELDVRKR